MPSDRKLLAQTMAGYSGPRAATSDAETGRKSIVRSLAKKSPKREKAQELYRKGAEALTANEVEMARSLFEDARKLDPSFLEADRAVSRLRMKKGYM